MLESIAKVVRVVIYGKDYFRRLSLKIIKLDYTHIICTSTKLNVINVDLFIKCFCIKYYTEICIITAGTSRVGEDSANHRDCANNG